MEFSEKRALLPVFAGYLLRGYFFERNFEIELVFFSKTVLLSEGIIKENQTDTFLT